MNLRNCIKCKRIFTSLSNEPICQECRKKEAEEFNKVRDFLKENRGADINIVSEETGVSIKKILEFLKQGRLEITDGIGEILKCEKCGVPIRTGKYCKVCSEKLNRTLKSFIKLDEDSKNTPKMHTKK